MHTRAHILWAFAAGAGVTLHMNALRSIASNKGLHSDRCHAPTCLPGASATSRCTAHWPIAFLYYNARRWGVEYTLLLYAEQTLVNMSTIGLLTVFGFF